MRSVRTLLFAALAAAPLVSAACGGGRTADPFHGGTAAESLRIFVENQNFNDVRIYVITTRGRQSLGQVGGQSSARFSIPWRQLDELRFRMEFLAGQNHETPRINAAPGDRVELRIGQNPRNAVIRRR